MQITQESLQCSLIGRLILKLPKVANKGYTNGWNRKSEEENSLSGLEKREKRLSCLGKSFKSVEKQSFHFSQSDRSAMRAKTASTNDGTDVC
jgi:hypothetical protein